MNFKYILYIIGDKIRSFFVVSGDFLVRFFYFLFNIDSDVDFITKETRKYIILLFGSFIVFFIFFVIVVSILLTPSGTVKVPNVVGVDIIEAVGSIESSKLVPSFEFVISEKIPRGTIIKQIPSPGNIVREGKTVKLYVSVGSGEFVMPDFSGKYYQDVISFLSSKGVVINVEYLQSTLEQGLVIKTYPSPGAKVKPGIPITIYVSSGSNSSFQMPNLIGFTYDKAFLFLDSKNVEFTVITVPVNDPANDGIILDQLPQEGQLVGSSNKVELTIGVFGDEEIAKNTKFILYKLPLAYLNVTEKSNYSVKVVIQDTTGTRTIEKQFDKLSTLILPIKVKGIVKISVYVDATLVKEDTL
ncbi:MAG: PASTA domain-containing protein [Brevinematia bacterium]